MPPVSLVTTGAQSSTVSGERVVKKLRANRRLLKVIDGIIIALAFAAFLFLDDKDKLNMATFLTLFAVFKQFMQEDQQVEEKKNE
jgi:hypothetical protein